MAVIALAAAAALMRIIALVAAVAGRWCFLECLVGVTIKTGSLFVFADEAETSNVVIKADLDPVDGRVAVPTGITHRFAVYIVAFVAGDAIRRCIAVLLAGCVAIATGDIIMFAMQLEVCGLVLKGRLIERHDICVSAFVIGMAERAVASFRVSVDAMETMF